MYLPIIFRQESINYLFSRRFILSVLLIFLPAAAGLWFSYMMYQDPSIIARMTGGWITQVTPRVCMLVYLDVAPLSVALTAIINASDFIAGERKRGMLQLLASKPVECSEVVIGKYLSFLLIFSFLVFSKMLIFNIGLKFLRIGLVENNVFLSYVLALFLIGVVYISISTLFSALMASTLAAILTGFLLLIAWYVFDWMLLYLPLSASNVLEKFSLLYYVNNIIRYASNEEAALFLGGSSSNLSFQIFVKSIIAVVSLTLASLAVSIILLQKKDIIS